MAVRGGWRPLSGLICEIVNSVGQGNFTFVREKSGKSQGISNTYGCGNHVLFSVTLFSGRITLSMCKMFKLAKEEADELAELDCSNIITASKEAC